MYQSIDFVVAELVDFYPEKMFNMAFVTVKQTTCAVVCLNNAFTQLVKPDCLYNNCPSILKLTVKLLSKGHPNLVLFRGRSDLIGLIWRHHTSTGQTCHHAAVPSFSWTE